MLPGVYTPKHEVLKDPELSGLLRSLTLECVNDDCLRADTNVSQAFASQETASGEQEVADKKEKETNGEFKEVYRHISRKLYDKAVEDRGWGTQRRQADAVGFLLAFCRMASGNNRLKGRSGKYLFKRELGKQAKKDRHIRQADSSHMWEAEEWY